MAWDVGARTCDPGLMLAGAIMTKLSGTCNTQAERAVM